MVLIRLIYENKGDIVILRIMFKKRLCKLSRVSVKITDISNGKTVAVLRFLDYTIFSQVV